MRSNFSSFFPLFVKVRMNLFAQRDFLASRVFYPLPVLFSSSFATVRAAYMVVFGDLAKWGKLNDVPSPTGPVALGPLVNNWYLLNVYTIT